MNEEAAGGEGENEWMKRGKRRSEWREEEKEAEEKAEVVEVPQRGEQKVQGEQSSWFTKRAKFQNSQPGNRANLATWHSAQPGKKSNILDLAEPPTWRDLAEPSTWPAWQNCRPGDLASGATWRARPNCSTSQLADTSNANSQVLPGRVTPHKLASCACVATLHAVTSKFRWL